MLELDIRFLEYRIINKQKYHINTQGNGCTVSGQKKSERWKSAI